MSLSQDPPVETVLRVLQMFRLSSYVGTFGYLVLVAELIFCGFVLFFFYRAVKLLRKERLKYFKVPATYTQVYSRTDVQLT